MIIEIIASGALVYGAAKVIGWLAKKPEPYRSEYERPHISYGGRVPADCSGSGDCDNTSPEKYRREQAATVKQHQEAIRQRYEKSAAAERERMDQKSARRAEWAQRDSSELPARGHSVSTGLEVPLDWEIPGALGSERPVEVDTAQWVKVRR